MGGRGEEGLDTRIFILVGFRTMLFNISLEAIIPTEQRPKTIIKVKDHCMQENISQLQSNNHRLKTKVHFL